MVNVNKDLLAPCGLYCGVCAIHIAHKNDDLKFKQALLPGFKAWGAETTDDLVCDGCMSNGALFSFCQNCSIKACLKEKEIEGCYKCDEFPCKIYEDWPSPDGKKIMLRAIPSWRKLGAEKWVESEEKRCQCPECGIQLFRGATTCNECNASMNPLI